MVAYHIVGADVGVQNPWAKCILWSSETQKRTLYSSSRQNVGSTDTEACSRRPAGSRHTKQKFTTLINCTVHFRIVTSSHNAHTYSGIPAPKIFSHTVSFSRLAMTRLTRANTQKIIASPHSVSFPSENSSLLHFVPDNTQMNHRLSVQVNDNNFNMFRRLQPARRFSLPCLSPDISLSLSRTLLVPPLAVGSWWRFSQADNDWLIKDWRLVTRHEMFKNPSEHRISRYLPLYRVVNPQCMEVYSTLWIMRFWCQP